MTGKNTKSKKTPNNISKKATAAILNLNNGSLISRNIRINKRRTSVRLDDCMWQALKEIASKEKTSVHDICTIIYDYKDSKSSLSTALRIFIVNYYRSHSSRK